MHCMKDFLAQEFNVRVSNAPCGGAKTLGSAADESRHDGGTIVKICEPHVPAGPSVMVASADLPQRVPCGDSSNIIRRDESDK